MKVSKQLLKAMAVGVALGTTTTACSLFEPIEIVEEVCNETCEEVCTVHAKQGHDNCPACGLG